MAICSTFILRPLNRLLLKLPFINYTLSFPFTALYCFGLYEFNPAGYAQKILDIRLNFLGKRFKLFNLIGENSLTHLNLNFHSVHVPLAFNDDLIMGFNTLNAYQYMFNLRRKDIDTSDNEHIIGASSYFFHPIKRTAADAWISEQSGKIFGAITNYWKCFLGEGCENKFTFLSKRQRFKVSGPQRDFLGTSRRSFDYVGVRRTGDALHESTLKRIGESLSRSVVVY